MKNLSRASAVLMVSPSDFTYNDQTGFDNSFQHSAENIPNYKELVLKEFNDMVENLRANSVDVLVLEYAPSEELQTPDAVFPNNWFSTEHDGTLITYPMFTENRRAERERFRQVELLLLEKGYFIRNLINVGPYHESKKILEGTGSMIIDHKNEFVYAALSQRCDESQFENFIHLRGYKKGIVFNTFGSNGKPIYHSNVMMSIGDSFAVICAECIVEEDRERVLNQLKQTHEVIEISMQQMEESFCGNILQIESKSAEKLIVMSEQAFHAYSQSQKKTLEKYGKLVYNKIDTIETIGGGSVRCMMAEIFSPMAEAELLKTY